MVASRAVTNMLTLGRSLWGLRRRKWAIPVAASAAVLLLIVLIGVTRKSSGSAGVMSARVQRGPLMVSVTEAGELEAERRKVISNELAWPVVILDVVEEGTIVNEGQTIVTFECKELMDAIVREELEVTSAKNNYTQAKQNLQLKKEEMANKVLKAERSLQEAEENQRQYQLHDYPIELRDKETAVKIAEQRLTLAKGQLDFKIRVNKMPELESPFSQNDIQADDLEVQQLQNSLENAKMELEKLQKFGNPRQTRELEDAIGDAKLALLRAKLEAENQLLIAKANEEAKRRVLEMRQKQLDEHLEDETRLTVQAERAGLVVYDTGNRGRWSSEPITIAKGEEMRPRQQMMVIPDMSSLQVKTKVYEAIIDQVQPGQLAYIRLDAKPDMTLTGKVSKVAPLPDSQNRWWSSGVKVYSVIVELDLKDNGLKPGMTTEVELILAKLQDVLTVPVAAVFTDKGQTICYRKKGDGCKRVVVKVGRMNDTRVEIVSGLDVDDEVMLAPPVELARTEEAENVSVAAEAVPQKSGRLPQAQTQPQQAKAASARPSKRSSGQRADRPSGRPKEGRQRDGGGRGMRKGGTQ